MIKSQFRQINIFLAFYDKVYSVKKKELMKTTWCIFKTLLLCHGLSHSIVVFFVWHQVNLISEIEMTRFKNITDFASSVDMSVFDLETGNRHTWKCKNWCICMCYIIYRIEESILIECIHTIQNLPITAWKTCRLSWGC